MKNKQSYKTVLYRDASLKAGFWSGRAVDKQINTPPSPTSDYWVADFLLSEFSVTSAQGTKRFSLGNLLKALARPSRSRATARPAIP
jgi:hypothetical protein